MNRVVHNPSGYRSVGRSPGQKAANFAEHIKPHGWSGSWNTDEQGVLHLFARRGECETIDIWWLPTGKAHPDWKPVFTIAGERINLLNVSAAAAMAVKGTDENRLKKAVRKQKRQFSTDEHGRVSQETIDSLTGSLPFDHESSDEEILEALRGRTIVWVNRISGETDSATVGGKAQHCKVIRNGHDRIDFVNPIPQRVLANFGKGQIDCDTYGFRSVYLDSIVSVD